MTTFIVINQLSLFFPDIIWAKFGFTHVGPIYYERISKPINNLSNFQSKKNKTNSILYKHCSVSLSPDPFFTSLFSFLFVRDTNLAHPIKNCSLHSLV